MNTENVEKLIQIVRKNEKGLPYINLDSSGNYAGWVTDFHMYEKGSGVPVKLDLSAENDMFVLFALASCWSRTGQWQNSACFAVYLKSSEKDKVSYWRDADFVQREKAFRDSALSQVLAGYDLQKPKKQIAFRSDFYDSLHVLANQWEAIKRSLKDSEHNNDYRTFIAFMSGIRGLGAKQNTMKIKIPLLLRELRIQDVFRNIPGKWCCVPDERVRKASADARFSIPLPKNNTTISAVLKSSEIIYDIFHDLYDLPLFAYADLQADWENWK